MRFSCCADCCAAGESRVRRPARSGGGRAGVQGYRQAAPAWRVAQAGKGMNGAGRRGRRARRSADAMHGEAREHCHAKRFLQHGSVGSGGKSRTLRRGDSKGCAGTTGKAPRRGWSAFLQKGLAKNLQSAAAGTAPRRGWRRVLRGLSAYTAGGVGTKRGPCRGGIRRRDGRTSRRFSGFPAGAPAFLHRRGLPSVAGAHRGSFGSQHDSPRALFVYFSRGSTFYTLPNLQKIHSFPLGDRYN